MATIISKKEIRRWMVERDIDTLRELAERAGISEATLYNALDREGWHSRTLDALARALDVNPVDLLTVEGEALAPVAIAA